MTNTHTLKIKNTVKPITDRIIIEANGYFGDMDESFYAAHSFPHSNNGFASATDFARMFEKLKDNRLDTYGDMKAWLESVGIEGLEDEIPRDLGILPRVETLTIRLHDSEGIIHNLKVSKK